MDVSEVRMTILDHAGATKAIGSITLNGEFAVRGVRVMESADGRNFISFPSRQRADGQYDDIAFPLTKELYHKVSDAVIKEYNTLKEAAREAREAAKDEFMDVAKMAEENPDAVFMEAVTSLTKVESKPETNTKVKAEADTVTNTETNTETPKGRKGRGR
ncbi:MAG: SpoVG family protein [Lachnospiraceae bacterium]|nr:SpoVG family protein [Lachnospiraceae bacterium]